MSGRLDDQELLQLRRLCGLEDSSDRRWNCIDERLVVSTVSKLKNILYIYIYDE